MAHAWPKAVASKKLPCHSIGSKCPGGKELTCDKQVGAAGYSEGQVAHQRCVGRGDYHSIFKGNLVLTALNDA